MARPQCGVALHCAGRCVFGRVRFYLRTFKGTVGAEANEEDLGKGRHILSPLFHTAHSVIAAVRESTPP